MKIWNGIAIDRLSKTWSFRIKWEICHNRWTCKLNCYNRLKRILKEFLSPDAPTTQLSTPPPQKSDRQGAMRCATSISCSTHSHLRSTSILYSTHSPLRSISILCSTHSHLRSISILYSTHSHLRWTSISFYSYSHQRAFTKLSQKYQSGSFLQFQDDFLVCADEQNPALTKQLPRWVWWQLFRILTDSFCNYDHLQKRYWAWS